MMMKGLINQQQQQVGMDQENMSNLTCQSGDQASASSDNIRDGNTFPPQHYFANSHHHDHPLQSDQPPPKKKRNLPGNPDPEAEVIALSPKTLMATNRFVCEVCKKGFQRDQNLQLHRRGHNLPWKLKQRTSKEVKKKVYICPEVGCIHHEPSRALGDLTGIKKHFCRKHGEKKWKCEKCSKRYAVQSDWKAHSKTCGTREYRCDCGTLFSRRDSFITHRAFCDALAEESARAGTGLNPLLDLPSHQQATGHLNFQVNQFSSTVDLNPFSLKKEQQNVQHFPPWLTSSSGGPNSPGLGPPPSLQSPLLIKTRLDDQEQQTHHHGENQNPNGVMGPTTVLPPYHLTAASAHMSATALLQKAAQMGATISSSSSSNPNCTSSSMTNMIPSGTHHQDHVPANSATTTAGFGLYLSSRDHHLDQLQSGGGPSYFHQDMIMMNALSSGIGDVDHGSTAFEDAMVNGFLDAKKEEVVVVGDDEMMIRGNGDNFGGLSRGNDGMTRDFLGLKPLSHTDIMTMAALTNSLGQHEGQSQTPRSW